MQIKINQTLSPREWRDAELKATDWIVPIIDHPQHAQTLEYRRGLRDWPSIHNYPHNKPTMEKPYG
jgi:hypothetical protein